MTRGQLVDEGRHHFAGATPVGVEVDHHRDLALPDRPIERLVVQHDWTVEEHWTSALAALRPVGGARRVDAIPGVAELAAQRNVLRPGAWVCGRGLGHRSLPARRDEGYIDNAADEAPSSRRRAAHTGR